ncbi:MAG: thioredoxin [Patescibacteria group bacterium]
MINVTKSNFDSEVKNFKGVVVADFFATWCGPCKMLSPLLEGMSTENKDSSVKFVKIDVDAEQDLAMQYDIMSIPTVIFFKDGKKVNQMIGLADKKDYASSIEKAKNYVAPAPGTHPKVTVFSTPTCPYCTMAKTYLKENNISFEDVDVSRDQMKAMQMVQKSGQMGVPQLWIGDEVVVGFDKRKIDSMLGL